jgi:hypothetical protein
VKLKWLWLALISAVILTGCGSSGGGEGSNEVERGIDWRCVGTDKVYTYFSNAIAVSPNSPDCGGSGIS